MGNAVLAAEDVDRTPRPAVSKLARWRAAVARLFPQAERAKAARGWVVTWYVTAFAAAVAYLLLIPAGRSRLTHVWAEDGGRFLLDSRTLPWWSNLVTPYEGYQHSLPRLAAELVSTLPLTWAAAGLAVAAALLRAGVALLVFTASGGFLRSLPVRLGLAALVVVAPVGNSETLDNLANFHWFALYGVFWLLLWRPASRWVCAMAAVLVFLAVTTSPLALLLAPLALARFALPGRRQALITAAFCLGAAVQFVTVLLATRTQYFNEPVNVKAAALAGVVRVALVAFTGSEGVAEIYSVFVYWPAFVALAITLVLVGAALRWGGGPRRLLAFVALGYSVGYIALSLTQNWRIGLAVFYPGVVMDAQRYSVAPSLFLLTAVAVGLDLVPRARWARVGMVAARVAVAAVLITGVVRQLPISTGTLTGIHWDQAVADARRDCASAPGKATARIVHEPAGWYITMPCDRMR